MSARIIHGDVRDVLATLPDQSVQCVVTSPPYFGLRDYGHDGQIGLEQSPDEYVAALVAVFREVRRVLRDDGSVFLNLGDSYARDPQKGVKFEGKSDRTYLTNRQAEERNYGPPAPTGLKPKDLIGIPWRVAFALQADGWWLRSDCIWHKPNPMPESVTDRPTKSHEFIFLLTKRERYYYDAEAIAEKSSGLTGGKFGSGAYEVGRLRNDADRERPTDTGTRNKRTVWTVANPAARLRHDLPDEQRTYVVGELARRGLL